MRKIFCLAAGALFSSMLITSTNAQILAERFYFKADAGASWLMDADLKEFVGEKLSGTDVEFDIGPRVGIGFGYHVTDWFAAEAEIGFMANSISKISNAQRADAVLGQAPFLINARLDIPTTTRFTPYVGIGGGGSAMYLDVDEIELDGTSLWGSGTSVVWAYQAFAGLQYKISDAVGLGVEFRYFGAGEPDFEGSDDYYHHSDSHDSIRFGRIEGYAVSVALSLRF